MDITLRSHGDILAAIANAKSVTLSAYVLPAESGMARALAAAADRGAQVAVTLDGAPYLGSAEGANPNLACADALRAHGVAVRLGDALRPAMHLKAAIVDGRGYLDDRNWPVSGRDTAVETDEPAAVAAIAGAIAGTELPASDLALHKNACLALEAATIRDAGDRIDVATESFGASEIGAALCERARAGATVRLEVNAAVLAHDASGREHRALARLAACGVDVRAVGAAEKYAVGGTRAWLGSANATAADGEMLDWGMTTADAHIAGTLARSFEDAWKNGKRFVPAQAPKRSAAVALVRATTSWISSWSRSATKAAVAAM